ncbi:hypothetical protein L1049_014422 [Liquidambar formosana]|uniref:Uncharacterized protein n=1 Tax=Liquidambar formosana TaxID=63359 RepID=A0AAP0X5E7_LIQFO
MVRALQMLDCDDRFVPPRLRGLLLIGFGNGWCRKDKAPGGLNADIPPSLVSNRTLSIQLAVIILLLKMQNCRIDRLEQKLTTFGILPPKDHIAATGRGCGRCRGP